VLLVHTASDVCVSTLLVVVAGVVVVVVVVVAAVLSSRAMQLSVTVAVVISRVSGRSVLVFLTARG